MYLGTKERTVWIKDPNTNSDYDVIGYLDTINYLNGGVGVRDSKNSHREYSYTWNVMSREMIGNLEGFSSGLYGDGLIYFLDPVAMDKNLFSAQWAAPKITAEDGIPLAGTVRPAKVLVGDTSLAYPLYGAQYSVTTSTPKREFYSPLPTGFTAWVGAHGTVAAKGLIVQPTFRGAPSGAAITVPVTAVNNPSPFSVSLNGATGSVDGFTVSLDTSATLTHTLSGLMLQVLPTGTSPTGTNFIPGRGNSGCEMSRVKTTPYYLPNEVLGASLKLIEVGDWL